MPVTLRKRAAPPAPAPPAKKKAPSKTKGKDTVPTKPAPEETAAKDSAPEAAKPSAPDAPSAPAPTKSSGGPPKVGQTITLDGFGGEVETNDGEKTTLAKLVGDSKAGVVLFTYPRASTPGCTKQACFFRDSYEPLTAGGLRIYGLSSDSPKANTTFKTKQNLPYPLLCDPAMTLISAIGFAKAPKSTTRGVFVVDKSGKVLVVEPGSPAGTVEVVKELVAGMGGDNKSTSNDTEKKVAETAAEVADSAAKVDSAA